ncbi:hypothetical protein, partial [Escherichia coli]|uniref:hypothetical protein n=1 Tax=Escherichia coli TaxID=562 RepID=UPI002022F299
MEMKPNPAASAEVWEAFEALPSQTRPQKGARPARRLTALAQELVDDGILDGAVNRPGFPGECFICELRLPDHRFRWKHNKLFLLLPEEYGPA